MKLKETYVFRTVGAERYLISMDPEAYNGMLRLNESAAFMVEQLAGEVSREQLEQALCSRYEIDPQRARDGAAALLEQLRSYGALEE